MALLVLKTPRTPNGTTHEIIATTVDYMILVLGDCTKNKNYYRQQYIRKIQDEFV
jgi:hypothetical protein